MECCIGSSATWKHASRALRYDVVAREWPDEALPKIGVDGSTALIALTHDPKIDDPAPIYALSSDAFYVGALESNKTHAKRHRGLGVI
jgi:xanthine/CO dehydrogenase XdhC/CoxF family maturation factor